MPTIKEVFIHGQWEAYDGTQNIQDCEAIKTYEVISQSEAYRKYGHGIVITPQDQYQKQKPCPIHDKNEV